MAEGDDYLEAFNVLVRENLVSIFVGTLQGSFLPFGSLARTSPHHIGVNT